MTTTTRLLTAEAFSELPDEPGVQHELMQGEVVRMPTPKPEHGLLVEAIGDILKAFVRGRQLGYVLRDNNSYVLHRNPDTVCVPDVSFVRRERLLGINVWEDYIPGAPDLAVEIVSPGDREDAVRAKAREYIVGGSRLVWVVWPKTHAVTVYTLDEEPREYRENDTLGGGDVLPGFSAQVRDLFAIEQ